MGEPEVAASTDCFGRESLSPVIATHMVADLDLISLIHALNRQATIAD